MDKLKEINQKIWECYEQDNKDKEKILNLVCEAFQNASDTFKKHKVKMNEIHITESIYELFAPHTWIELKRKYKFQTIWVVVNGGLYRTRLDEKGNLSNKCILIENAV